MTFTVSKFNFWRYTCGNQPMEITMKSVIFSTHLHSPFLYEIENYYHLFVFTAQIWKGE